MKRTVWIAMAVIVLVGAGLLAGCEGEDGGGPPGLSTYALGFVGDWLKTFRSVNGTEEVPIGWPMRLHLNADATYTMDNDLGYTEFGTWGMTDPQHMVLARTNNSNGSGVDTVSADFEEIDADNFRLTYNSRTGPGTFVAINEVYTRQP